MLRPLLCLLLVACNTSYADQTPRKDRPPAPRCEPIVNTCACSMACGDPETTSSCARACPQIDPQHGMRCVVKKGRCHAIYPPKRPGGKRLSPAD